MINSDTERKRELPEVYKFNNVSRKLQHALKDDDVFNCAERPQSERPEWKWDEELKWQETESSGLVL